MKDKWTQQFQEKMDGYEMAAPEMEWTELDKALAKNRKPAMTVVWGRRIAAAAAVALLVIGGARVLLPGPEAEKGEAPQQNCGERWLTQRQEGTSQRQEGLSGDDEAEAMPILAKADKPQLAKADSPQIVDAPNTAEEKQAQAKSENATPQPATERRRDSGMKKTVAMPIKRRNYHGGELTAAVFMQNSMTANSSRNMGGLVSSPMNSSPYGTFSEEFRYGTLDFLSASNPESVSYNHDRPIKVGLSVKYNIDNRWSISSGLTYSYLRSSFDYSEGKMSGSGVQKLHYVGLPLSASYNVVSAKRLKVYLTAGGEMQKLVSGKATMDGVNIPEEDKKHDIREGGMQWSLNAAVGAEYNIVDNFGIYVEPGVSHYIDNKSNVENFYKYKPTNFSLNVGLRLSIR
ncbi:MAG: porin family protein [Prevotella sp.]